MEKATSFGLPFLYRTLVPGAMLIVTTPNQLSLLSKLTLVLKNQFDHFQERPGLYPSHITALLEIDLIRIARECRLVDIRVEYTRSGRVVFTPWKYPALISGLSPRACSDNVLMIARKPK